MKKLFIPVVILLAVTGFPLPAHNVTKAEVKAEVSVIEPQEHIFDSKPVVQPAPKRIVHATRSRTSLPKKSHRVTKDLTGSSVWSRLRQCESGSDGLYLANTGNGFYGAYQFTKSSWAAVGGTGYPQHATPSEQDMRAKMLKSLQGWGAWPACSRKLGLR